MSRKRKKSKERTLVFEGLNKRETLSRVTAINLEAVDKEFVYLDKLPDGTWQLTFTSKTIPDADNLVGILLAPKDQSPGKGLYNPRAIKKARFGPDDNS